MKQWARKQSGFTIVELLIVVVVIAILATITIVAYNGIRQRSELSAMQSTLSQAAKKVQLYAVDNADQYPATLSEAGVTDNGSITYQYSSDNTTTPKQYSITATKNKTDSYYVSSTAPNNYQSGIYPGHNTIVWYENDLTAPLPIPNGVVDSASPHSAPSSIRLGPGVVGASLRNSPYSVVQGQTYTVNLWVRSDSTWNGTMSNSKIRIANQVGGALITACSYNGVKLTWTQFSCSYTVAAGITGISISAGNDGTIGNVWLDDISLSITGP
ncbi:MAG: prepilin-type N-terminal cleavage/methylation domain-containing protein [Patescibacteria group bacterium]